MSELKDELPTQKVPPVWKVPNNANALEVPNKSNASIASTEILQKTPKTTTPSST
jgi:hypothetical protein